MLYVNVMIEAGIAKYFCSTAALETMYARLDIPDQTMERIVENRCLIQRDSPPEMFVECDI